MWRHCISDEVSHRSFTRCNGDIIGRVEIECRYDGEDETIKSSIEVKYDGKTIAYELKEEPNLQR